MPRRPILSPDAPGPAASFLGELARRRPYVRSSFYLKAKLSSSTPEALPPQVTVDITHQCGLGCPFCFASATARRGDHFPLAALKPLLEELRGLPSLVLIGGEPFEHPEFPSLLGTALSLCGEVEVYTSGHPFQTLEGLREKLAAIPASLRSRLRLVLSVDKAHKERLWKHWDTIVQAVLACEAQGLCRVRFNATDATFSTRRYLGVPEVMETLESLHPRLATFFRQCLSDDTVDEYFQFNPLIAQGRQQDEGQAERLKLADLLFHPEPVLRWQNGKAELLRNLNAAWMPEPPFGLFAGTVPPGGLTKLLRTSFLRDEERDSQGEPCSEGALVLGRLTRFLADPQAYTDALARRALSVLPKGVPVDLSAFWNIDRLRLPVLKTVFSTLLDDASARDDLVRSLADTLRTLAANGVPAWTETDEYGHEQGMHPFREVGLLRAFHAYPDDAGPMVQPRLWIDADQRPHFEIPGLVAVATTEPGTESWERLAQLLVLWLDERVLRSLSQAVADVPQIRNALENAMNHPLAPEPPPQARDVFQYVAFDANRDAPPWQAPELTQQAVLALFSQNNSVVNGLEPLLNELRYWQRRTPETTRR